MFVANRSQRLRYNGSLTATDGAALQTSSSSRSYDYYDWRLLWKIGVHPPLRQALAKSLPLLVVIAAAFTATSIAQPVATVEPVAAGLPTPPWPLGGMDLWLTLLPSAIAVAIIVFVTATAVAKSLLAIM